MRMKVVPLLAVVLILINLYLPICKVQSTNAAVSTMLYVPTFYIRSNGTIEQPTPVISSLDNITYTFNSSIQGSLQVERSNIIVDFAGFTIQGSGSEVGVNLIGVNNVTVKNAQITTFGYGIFLGYNSLENKIVGNNITTTLYGISVDQNSNDNTISGNQIMRCTDRGIWIDSSANNTVDDNNVTGCGSGIAFEENANGNFATGNNVTRSGGGIFIDGSSDNTVIENDAANNNEGLEVRSGYNNTIAQNTFAGDGTGIGVGGNATIIIGNNITQAGSGILLAGSDNVLRNNTIVNSTKINFQIDTTYYFANDVDKSNTIDGKPILYLVNKQDLIVDPQTEPDIAYLGIANSTGITIRNLRFEKNAQGVLIAACKNCLIQNVTVADNTYGIQILGTTYDRIGNNTIFGCNITSNSFMGIQIHGDVYGNPINNNTVSNNIITGNYYGISVVFCYNNTVQENTIMNNSEGIQLYTSGNNIWHNNFVSNVQQTDVFNSNNFWDCGYPLGGNYWSDYNGTDALGGALQNITGSDGIGDATYTIGSSNIDHYPLMGMFSGYSVTSLGIQSICNSTISNLQFNGTAISFDVSGPSGTIGFCRICIPRALMVDPFRVFVNGTEVQYTRSSPSNDTNSYLYFTYHHSTQEVIVIPEFPSFAIWPLLLLSILLTVVFHRHAARGRRAEYVDLRICS